MIFFEIFSYFIPYYVFLIIKIIKNENNILSLKFANTEIYLIFKIRWRVIIFVWEVKWDEIYV